MCIEKEQQYLKQKKHWSNFRINSIGHVIIWKKLIQAEVEESWDHYIQFPEKIANTLSSCTTFTEYLLIAGFLDALIFSQFSIDTFRSSKKGKMIADVSAKCVLLDGWWKMFSRKGVLEILRQDFGLQELLIYQSVVETPRNEVRYVFPKWNMMPRPGDVGERRSVRKPWYELVVLWDIYGSVGKGMGDMTLKLCFYILNIFSK